MEANEACCEIARLPEELLSAALARTSPRDACRAAAVSPAFRAAADSDSVWACFLPRDIPPLADGELPPATRKKDLYLRLSHSPVLLPDKRVTMGLRGLTSRNGNGKGKDGPRPSKTRFVHLPYKTADQDVQHNKVDLGFANQPRSAADRHKCMTPRVAAADGGRPARESSRTILCDLLACIYDQVRIVHHTLDGVRRFFCNRGTERRRESARRTGIETVNITEGEKESSAEHDDCNQQQAEDDLNGGAEDDDCNQQQAEDGLNGGAEDGLNGGAEDDLNSGDEDDLHSNDDDYDDDYDIEVEPSLTIHFDEGDSYNIRIAYSFSRYLVEVLSVRPRFPFSGTFVAFNDCSAYYFHLEKGQPYRYFDSQGNLILRAQGNAIEDGFRIRIEIPDENNRIEAGNLSFTVDPYACNKVITRTIPTIHCRKIDVTFVALYRAIQANVFVSLDLAAAGGGSSSRGTVCYVYGEITAHHQLYGDKNVLLFYRGEEDKLKFIGGELPLLRPWAAVPIYQDPLLTIKLSLHVSNNSGHDGDGRTISFQGDLTFDRDQYEKTICNADSHGEVKVQITYQ